MGLLKGFGRDEEALDTDLSTVNPTAVLKYRLAALRLNVFADSRHHLLGREWLTEDLDRSLGGRRADNVTLRREAGDEPPQLSAALRCCQVDGLNGQRGE